MDFSQGRYHVFSAEYQLIGRIDGDEFVRNGVDLIYRIDGDEVYTAGPSATLLGFIESRTARDLSGNILFTIEDE